MDNCPNCEEPLEFPSYMCDGVMVSGYMCNNPDCELYSIILPEGYVHEEEDDDDEYEEYHKEDEEKYDEEEEYRRGVEAERAYYREVYGPDLHEEDIFW